MAFIQYKIDKSFNQSRGIFDGYIYKTDDTKAEIQVAGYFDECRFITDADWVGSVITANCSDGFITGNIGSDNGMTGPVYPFDPITDLSIQRLIEGTSLAADQQPTGLGISNSINVEFGAAIGTPSDPVEMDVDGMLTFNKGGLYRIKVVFQFGRSGASGTSEVLFRFLINGAQLGRSVGTKLGNSDDLRYIDIDNWFNVPEGSTLVTQIMRDSSGSDSGGLFQTIPTDEGAGTWSNVPCAVMRVERLVATP